MARIWQSGFELNSTAVNMEFQSCSGTVSFSTTTVRTGTYAGRSNPTAGTGFFRQVVAGSNQIIPGFFRAYIRIATPPASVINVMRFADNVNNRCAGINLNSDSTLNLTTATGVTIGSSSSALLSNTWYRIEIKNDSSTNPGVITGLLDGVQFATGNNDAATTGAWDRVLCGVISGATSPDIFWDDLAVNDNSGSFQTSYPGSGSIIFLRPDSAGDINGFLTQVGGTAGSTNNFTRVNEVPPDDVTSYNATAVTAEDLLNCGASGLSSTDTVNTVLVGARFTNLVGADATAAFKVEVEKTASGTKLQSAAIIPNATTWATNAPASPFAYPIITYQDPDGASWTKTTLDSMQIGYNLTAANTRAIAVSNIWASVDYTPGPQAPVFKGTKFFQLMGVGT